MEFPMSAVLEQEPEPAEVHRAEVRVASVPGAHAPDADLLTPAALDFLAGLHA
jgi:hypothetical protein